MTSSVIFNDPSKFKTDLLDASRRNDSMEIDKIIEILNGKTYSDYTELARDAMMFVDELDPFDREYTIEFIFDRLLPEHKELFNPVRIVLASCNFNRRRKSLLSGCFS